MDERKKMMEGRAEKGESHDPYFSTVFHRLSVNNKLPSVFLSTYFTDNDGR